ncbi:MAG: DUF4139 domain-containing protein [Kiritimatiellia bacterium]
MRLAAIICSVLFAVTGFAKVDLVTLPVREGVQLTIYNSADLTLVRENRALTLSEGNNKLQFSWANTLIDPTSLEMIPLAYADEMDIADLTYPPRTRNLGLWNVKSGRSGKVPVEINYLTSGFSWRAFYMGTLSEDERTMRLQGYVRVTNNSGEDYENAQTRLIVGKVNIIDQIAELARREYPYGRPWELPTEDDKDYSHMKKVRRESKNEIMMAMAPAAAPVEAIVRQKEIKKEGLSEYFLYTIEGTETIPHGWSKRLPSFDVAEVPVVNLYKFEENRYGPRAVRFLSFKNDKEHKLGETPIPDGRISVYRTVDEAAHLSYEGRSSFKYIPVDEKVELNIGAVLDVTVEPKLMDYKTDQYLFDRKGNIRGWDEISSFEVEVKNMRPVAVKIEIIRNFSTQYWELEKSGDFGEFEKTDMDTVKFTLELPPHSEKIFKYKLTVHYGDRRD